MSLEEWRAVLDISCWDAESACHASQLALARSHKTSETWRFGPEHRGLGHPQKSCLDTG